MICGKLENGPSRSVLTWKIYQAKMNWGVLLVIGGGFAMANASDLSGFSSWFASGLQRAVENLPTYAIAIIVSLLAALFTEICSNTAATALFVPLLAELRTVFNVAKQNFQCSLSVPFLKIIKVLVFVSILFIFCCRQHLHARFHSCYQVRLLL